MPITDRLTPILYDVKAALAARVNMDIAASAHARIDVVYGQQATIDDCCPNGYGWVRVVRTFPYTSFPNQLANFTNCPVFSLAAEVEIGMSRCSAVPGDDGTPPPQSDIEDVADLISLDRSAMQQAVYCDIIELVDNELVASAWTPLPDAGGCAGGIMTLTFPYEHCCDEPES